MRRFSFTLQLPDGRIETTDSIGRRWDWAAAFSAACRHVEAQHQLAPASGLVCVAYSSVLLDPVVSIPEAQIESPLSAAA